MNYKFIEQGKFLIIKLSGRVEINDRSIMRLEARKISKIFPGHGEISQNPEQDLS
jgi:hypothetical protein